MTLRRLPFISLVPGEDAAAVKQAIDRVVARGWFILGPEVDAPGPSAFIRPRISARSATVAPS
jgi:hypothetical protein